MFWVLIPSLAIFLLEAEVSSKLPPPPDAHIIAAMWEDSYAYDVQAERELLELANRERAHAQLTQFKMDEGLTRAAREHAAAMAKRGELSHQFPGEPDLAQRIAANCKLYLVEAAENVAYADSTERAHDGLMHSPPHRENLLHPSYNTIGIGVVRRGDTLYVVQDFGNSIATQSGEQVEAAIAQAVERQRTNAKLSALKRLDGVVAHKQACAMAGGDSLKANAASEGRHILRYTSIQPVNLPAQAAPAINDDSVHAYAVGSCFSRSKSYPNGIYWIVLIFY
jgi:cysteine-rich secretory family protein